MPFRIRGRHRPTLLVTACTSLFVPLCATLADDVEEIVVTSEPPASLTARTAEEARRLVDELAAAATVIDAATLQSQRTQTLADALRLAPGVFASPRFGDEDLRLSIRGSGIVRTGHGKGVLLLRDGVVVNQADGNFDPPVFDFASASHITILRGTAALGIGASTLGGAIAVDSRTGRTHAGASTGVSAGSFGQRRVHAEGGLSGQRFDGYGAVSASRFDGYRAQSETSSLRLAGNAGVRLSEQLETRVFVAHARTDAEWPGALSQAQFDLDPRLANAVSIARDQSSDIRQTLLSSRTVWVDHDQSWSLGLGWNDRFKNHPTPGGILEEDSRTGSLALDWRFTPAERPIDLRAGLRAATMDQDALTFAYAGPVGSPQSAAKGALAADRARRAATTEAYLRLGYDLSPRVTATASLAALRTTRRDRDGRADPAGDPAYRLSYDGLMPGVGLRWQGGETWSAFASLSRTREAPSFFDLGGNAPLNPDRLPRLRMQRADTLEAGARGRAGATLFDLTVYHARLDGELLRLDAAGQLNPPIVNAERTLRTGLEAAIEHTLSEALFAAGPALQLAAKYDWSQFRFDDDPVYGSNRVAGIPEHAAYGELRVVFAGGLTLTPNLTWRGRTTTDLANTVDAPGAVLGGLNASYERGRWRVWVDARNLTDRRWVSAVNVVNRATPAAGLFFPGDGRALYAGISVSLQ